MTNRLRCVIIYTEQGERPLENLKGRVDMRVITKIVDGDIVRVYDGAYGEYEVIKNGYRDSYDIYFTPYNNKTAPRFEGMGWEFVPDGSKRFHDRREKLRYVEQAINEWERRVV